MDSRKEMYEIKFTKDCKEEIVEIYEYISKKLVAENSAKQLMGKMRNSVMNLSKFPNIYPKIEKKDKYKRQFRRMVIDNYVILYTVDENKKDIYIAHMYYGKRNYLFK